jgi:hypothetical protein
MLSTHVIQSIIGVTAYRATNGEILLPYLRMSETEKIGYSTITGYVTLTTIILLPEGVKYGQHIYGIDRGRYQGGC